MSTRNNVRASDAGNVAPETLRVRVWDLPTRLFHWLVVALFAVSWWTAENDKLEWHRRSGYAILTLILFRIYWGFAGSATARFLSFVRGPKAFLAYAARLLDKGAPATPGHNPMGGWSVLALLLLLLIETCLGLFAIDVDGDEGGPLDNLVSFDTARTIAGWHEAVFNLLLVVVTLHIAAILFYLVYKRENLVAAMFSGAKPLPIAAAPQGLRFVSAWWAVPGLLIAGGIVAWIALGRF